LAAVWIGDEDAGRERRERMSTVDNGKHARVRAGPVLLVAALNLASCKGRPPSDTAAAHAGPSPDAAVPARLIKTADFTMPLPDGYDDVSADVQKNAPQFAAAVAASKLGGGYKATIVVQKAPIPGGSFADPATCTQTGNGLMTGGTKSPGINGTLESAAIIDGPVGKTCQIRVLAPEGIFGHHRAAQDGKHGADPEGRLVDDVQLRGWRPRLRSGVQVHARRVPIYALSTLDRRSLGNER
jgi:hypothetical protein